MKSQPSFTPGLNWTALAADGAYHSKVTSEDRIAYLKREETQKVVEDSRRQYGKALRSAINKRLETLEQPYNVTVSPLVDYRDYFCCPHVTVQWMAKAGRFDFEAVVRTDKELNRLIRRIMRTVALNTKG